MYSKRNKKRKVKWYQRQYKCEFASEGVMGVVSCNAPKRTHHTLCDYFGDPRCCPENKQFRRYKGKKKEIIKFIDEEDEK